MPRPDAITFRQLRALVAVAKFGTISAAAEETGLTPPAVHSQLRSLASNLKAEVLARSPSGGMELTQIGEIVIRAAQRIETELAACMEEVGAVREGKSGIVRLGVVSTGKYFAPALVVRLRERFPGIDVRLVVGNRDQIVAALHGRSVDLAIMGRPPRAPQVDAEVIGPHPHVMIAPPHHPLANRPDVPTDALLDETFIAREQGSGTRILMTRYLDQIGEGSAYTLIEMGTNETIKQAVMAGLGIAMISRHTVCEELRSGRLATIDAPGLPIVRQWFLLHRTDMPPEHAVARVHDFISELGANMLPDAACGTLSPPAPAPSI